MILGIAFHKSSNLQNSQIVLRNLEVIDDDYTNSKPTHSLKLNLYFHWHFDVFEFFSCVSNSWFMYTTPGSLQCLNAQRSTYNEIAYIIDTITIKLWNLAFTFNLIDDVCSSVFGVWLCESVVYKECSYQRVLYQVQVQTFYGDNRRKMEKFVFLILALVSLNVC